VPAQVELETAEMLVLRRSTYDRETDLASLYLTCFEREEEEWRRYDELHRCKGYPVDQIRALVRRTELQEIACWGSIQDWRAPQDEDGRVWIAARPTKGGSRDA
jgi:hypothetical protein